MKNILRLVFVFSLSFAVLFVVFLVMHWLQSRLDPAMQSEGRLLWISVLPITIYGAMLLGLRYTIRVSIPIPLAILSLVILGLLCTGGLALGISRFTMPAYSRATLFSLGKPGLLLSMPDKAVVLLYDPQDPSSPQVLSLPGKPLVYLHTPQEGNSPRRLAAPLVSFRTASPPFLQGILNDFASTAAQLQTRLNLGFVPFMIYIGALIVLLSSVRFICTLGAWPLANLCVRILVFRGVLALEAFLNTPRIQRDLLSLLGSRLPQSLLSPVLLYTLGLLFILSALILHLIRKRSRYAS
ncbi:MAG: hypothetical protein LBC51_05220 [Treponema sp.]|jgi:hypothetical protein|nr:hypothetical protein [Treponema sp.]